MLEDVYLKNANIPIRYMNDIPLTATENDDIIVFGELNDIRENIKDFVSKGNNLLICSQYTGNGKTTWSIKLLKAYIKAFGNRSAVDNTPALFINVNNFLNEKKLSIDDRALNERVRQIEKSILSANLVVFDDIADKSLSDYELGLMYYWLDYRTANMKSCIYTTNYTVDQLRRNLSGKLYSRIVNYSIVKNISGKDHRSC